MHRGNSSILGALKLQSSLIIRAVKRLTIFLRIVFHMEKTMDSYLKSLNAGHDHSSSLVSSSNTGLTRNCLENWCMQQPSQLVWAVLYTVKYRSLGVYRYMASILIGLQKGVLFTTLHMVFVIGSLRSLRHN